MNIYLEWEKKSQEIANLNRLTNLKFKEGILECYTIKKVEYKSTSAQQSIYYYHIGVKVDNMFLLSGSHHQVQSKDT